MRRTDARSRGLNDRGASAVEYGILIAAICAIVALGAFGLGDLLFDTFEHTNACITNAGNPC